jgi:hypothetical protein
MHRVKARRKIASLVVALFARTTATPPLLDSPQECKKAAAGYVVQHNVRRVVRLVTPNSDFAAAGNFEIPVGLAIAEALSPARVRR